MSAEEPISKLIPSMGSFRKDEQRRNSARALVNEIAIHATKRSGDLLVEIYLAGLWHGAELMRQNAQIELGDAMRPR